MYTNNSGDVELCDDVTDVISYVFEPGDPPALTVTFQLRADRQYDPAGSLRLHTTNGINHRWFMPKGSVAEAPKPAPKKSARAASEPATESEGEQQTAKLEALQSEPSVTEAAAKETVNEPGS